MKMLKKSFAIVVALVIIMSMTIAVSAVGGYTYYKSKQVFYSLALGPGTPTTSVSASTFVKDGSALLELYVEVCGFYYDVSGNLVRDPALYWEYDYGYRSEVTATAYMTGPYSYCGAKSNHKVEGNLIHSLHVGTYY